MGWPKIDIMMAMETTIPSTLSLPPSCCLSSANTNRTRGTFLFRISTGKSSGSMHLSNHMPYVGANVVRASKGLTIWWMNHGESLYAHNYQLIIASHVWILVLAFSLSYSGSRFNVVKASLVFCFYVSIPGFIRGDGNTFPFPKHSTQGLCCGGCWPFSRGSSLQGRMWILGAELCFFFSFLFSVLLLVDVMWPVLLQGHNGKYDIMPGEVFLLDCKSRIIFVVKDM